MQAEDFSHAGLYRHACRAHERKLRGAVKQEGRRPKPLRPAKAGTQQIAVEQNGGRGRLVNHAGW